MDRRAFLRRAAIVATGAIAADQLDLLDRLGWARRLFTTGGWAPSRGGIVVTKAQWDALLEEDYIIRGIVEAVTQATPFKSMLLR